MMFYIFKDIEYSLKFSQSLIYYFSKICKNSNAI